MQLKKVLAVALLGGTLAGCQTTDPYTGEAEATNSTKYGLGGVLAGAAIGALADGGEGAWKGALIGGAAGAGYGHYTDTQEAKLRAELRGTGVQVKRQGNDLTLIMPGNITFETNRADIKSSFYPVLGSLTKVFKEFNQNLVQVVGYTDSTGGDSINYPLSENRANSVAQYFINQGVPGSRINSIGRGPQNPIASNKSKEGRAMNRRVEINLLPPPAKS